MVRLLIQAQKTYGNYENHVDWIKGAIDAAEAARVQHDIKSWTATQCNKNLAWAGKVAQSHEGRWTTTSSSWKPNGIRPRGRPKHRWHDSINNFLTLHTGVKHKDDDWMGAAKDQSTWSGLEEVYVHYADFKQ